MSKKQLKDITAFDLFESDVWEYIIIDNIEFVIPSDKKEISETDNKVYIVRTDFTLISNTKLTGFCSPQDPSGIDYIQPVILTDKGQVELWNDSGWTTSDKNEALEKIVLYWKDIFPIEYNTLVKCDGEFYCGTISDFNNEK